MTFGGKIEVRVSAFVLAILAMASMDSSSAKAFTYYPTEQDRSELRACIKREHLAQANINDIVADCGVPVLNRIRFEALNVMHGTKWPEHPSQSVSWVRSAGLECGGPDFPGARGTPATEACMKAKVPELYRAIAEGLGQAVANILNEK